MNLCNHAPFVLNQDHPAFDSSRTLNSPCSRIPVSFHSRSCISCTIIPASSIGAPSAHIHTSNEQHPLHQHRPYHHQQQNSLTSITSLSRYNPSVPCRLAASIPLPRLYSACRVQARPLCFAFACVRFFVYQKHSV
ncbi:uncharacterized protein LACBIDRAFT_313492 [Laccaria bicolor S238N-H82]|uniref:Predicted protein n=1 Tax=Laccaria bicolor (strain S238N-H82 / ATCC MYA-4686) TaxID=486041 RepID=B0D048_LACBS|nr:uncharacterized protein LACBIDRAFT_313492 [Laccaria bicolor S238N-H82]EDR11393.1 predicted protein [Laccaria bicolor S238N-H82]|eukprot:XP_001877290.1 predicted protein [Laccaria bicolor S238N-H82]